MRKNILILSIIIAAGFLMSSCGGLVSSNDNKLTASGTISAESVNIAPEIGGVVKEVFI